MKIVAFDEKTKHETYSGDGDFTIGIDPRDPTLNRKALFLNFGGITVLYENNSVYLGDVKVNISNFTQEELGKIKEIENQ